MTNDQYKEALEQEIAKLKEEHYEIVKHVRPQTLEAMKTKQPDELLKKVHIGFFAKRIAVLLTILLLMGGIALIAGSFIKEMSIPYAEDMSTSDPDFIPDTDDNFNTVGSSTAHPLIAAQGEIFYLSDGIYIYKYINGEKITVAEGAATHINAYKYCIYYYDTNDRTIYKIRTDGKEKIALIQNASIADMKAYNNTLYALTDKGDIHRIYTNGKNGYLFMEGENIFSFTVADGHIYYIRKDSDALALYRTKISGQETVKVSNVDSALIAAQGDHIFYIHNGTLYGLNRAEEKAYAFFSGNVTDFILLKDTLLIIESNALYRADVNGTSIELISDGIKSLTEISPEELMVYGEERRADK